MLRFFTFGAVVIALTSAFVLYTINTQTRRIALEISTKQRLKSGLINRIATLKAERAFLARAERIAPAAEALGMRPASGDQFRTMSLPAGRLSTQAHSHKR